MIFNSQHDRLKKMRERQLNDLFKVLSSKEGRGTLFRLIAISGALNQTTMSGDALTTAFNEGKRFMGNELLMDIVENKPEVLLQMKKEYEQEGMNANGS